MIEHKTALSGTRTASSHLRKLLVDAGVGTTWCYRELERQSGHRLSREYWRRLVLPIPAGERGHRWKVDDLRIVADTLRRVGARASFEQIERAVLTDLGYTQTVAGNDYVETAAKAAGLSQQDRLRLISELAAGLALAR